MSRSTIRRAFTLIEMLVVIAIILILAGIVFKTMGLVFRNSLKAKATHDLQQLQNALNEYYKEYSQYPPVNFLTYEFEGSNTRAPLGEYLTMPQYNDPNNYDQFIPDMKRSTWPQGKTDDLKFQYGLVSYLWPRDRKQVHWYDQDTARDVRAKAKWAGFLEDVGLSGDGAARQIQLHALIGYSNDTQTILDPWGREYQYQSMPPYQSYKLWSLGPDAGNPADDLNAEASF